MTQLSITCLTAPAGLVLQRPAMALAHPGHELHAFGWLSSFQPLCFVLTDGARGGGAARLETTAGILDQTRAARGDWFGSLSDAEIHDVILRRDGALLCALADRLADALVAGRIDHLIADAEEYFNPAHDICSYIAAAAAVMAGRRTGRNIPVFHLFLAEETCGRSDETPALHYRLGDDLLAAKLKAAAAYQTLEREVQSAIGRFGEEYFRDERFYLVGAGDARGEPGKKPYYEIMGERRVVSGQYHTVIRWADHVRPIRDTIRAHAAEN